MKSKWFGPLLCALALLAAILATCPRGPVPFADDWDYDETARAVAQTGRLSYHNWGEPTLGIQAYWGALFVKLFGPSFEAIRFSTIPVALGCAILLYLLGRRLQCSEKLCWFGTLAVMTSPIALSLEASFMTELPSLFFELLCVMALMQALRANTPKLASHWLTGFTISCLLGGSIRQSNWLIAASLPFIAVYWRRQRKPWWLCASAVAAGCLLLAVATWFQHWYQRQPGSVHHALLNPTGHSPVYELAKLSFLFLSTIAIFVLPCTLLFLRQARHSAAYVLAGLVFWGLAYLWTGKVEHIWRLFPTGALTSSAGIATTTILGNQRWRPGYFLWLALAAVAASMALIALGAMRSARWSDDVADRHDSSTIRFQWFVIILPFVVAYTAAVEVRSREFWLQDRYPLPLLPVVAFSILMLYQQGFGRIAAAVKIPAYCWGLLSAFAYFSVAGTHDHYAALRAVHNQAETLISTGIPRTSIIGGFEFDAPTQLITAGRLKLDPKRPHNFSYWFSPYLSADHGRWLITEAHYPGMLPTQWPPLLFTLWLPPFRQQVLVEQVPDVVTGPK